MDARSSLRDNNRNAMPPRQASRARAPALTGIVILLMRPDRTRQALGFLKKTQSHESGFGAGFWSHECVLCRPKTSRVGVARFLSGPLAAIARRLLASDVTEMLPGQDLEQVVLRAGLGQVLALLDDAFAVRVGAGRAGLQGGDSNHSKSCHVRRGSPDPAVRPTGGLQVTRRRSGTGRPAVAEDGRVRRPCPNQRNKSERKENTSQPQLCGTPGPLPASGTMIRTDRGARRPTRSDQRAEGPAHRRTHG